VIAFLETASVYPPEVDGMIVVTGATGSIGRHLVAALQAAGVPFRAMARTPADARLDCPVVPGDFDDPASLAAAFAGADQLFLNTGGAQPVDGPQPMIGQQIAAIDAAKAAGISHVVKVSVWRAAPGRLLAEGAHGVIERHLAASGIRATVLQPNAFLQNLVTGAGAFNADGHLVGAYGEGRVSYIDCADIAACASAVLTDPARRGGVHVLTGPEALSHREIAAAISAAVGRAVPTLDLTPDELAAALRAQGSPDGFAADVAALAADAATGALEATTSAVRDFTGRPPRTLAQFLAANGAALRHALGAATG
jgi:uncharacterized protein YbjT (DUF2867 family)